MHVQDETYLLQVQINLPKSVYDTQELFHFCNYNISFPTKSEIFVAFYTLKTEELSSLIETKLQEHIIFHFQLLNFVLSSDDVSSAPATSSVGRLSSLSIVRAEPGRIKKEISKINK